MADMGEAPCLQAQLTALRTSGAAERDPVRFVFLEGLARRIALHPEVFHQSLIAKFSANAEELANRPVPLAPEIPLEQVASPLSELLSYISQQVHAQPVPTQINQGTSLSSRESRPESGSASNRIRRAPELKSVAYFRNEWSKLSTEQQLTQTLAQAPENAGPMNSQHLVLRSLERMRDIAPDYLQGFMSYIDTLIWLEHADPTKKSIRDFSAVDKESKTRTKRSAPSRGKS